MLIQLHVLTRLNRDQPGKAKSHKGGDEKLLIYFAWHPESYAGQAQTYKNLYMAGLCNYILDQYYSRERFSSELRK